MNLRKQIALGALTLALTASAGLVSVFADEKPSPVIPSAPPPFVPPPPPPPPNLQFGLSAQPMPKLEKGFKRLYDGKKLEGWTMAGPGGFAQLSDGSLIPVDGMGLLWYSKEKFKDFILKVDWKAMDAEANSGIFVRFPDPKGDPWKPVNEGYEIQINDGSDAKHKTGAVYTFSESSFQPNRPYGQWNTMEIKVVGKKYTAWVNGRRVTEYEGDRSLEGYIGIQNHEPSYRVVYRNIRIKKL